MARFFETFNVVTGDGGWSRSPQPIDTLSAGVAIGTYDICNPDSPGDAPEFSIGADVSPFAIKAYIKAPTRCSPDDLEQYIRQAMDDSAEYAVTKALWSGADGISTEMHLNGDDVTTVARSGDSYAQLSAALTRAYADTPFLKPVIHLGFQSAMTLQLGLQNLGLPFVVAPGYPGNAIAVTGPVTVRLGTIETTKAVTTDDNRLQVEATRLARIEFDPYMAVRIAD